MGSLAVRPFARASTLVATLAVCSCFDGDLDTFAEEDAPASGGSSSTGMGAGTGGAAATDGGIQTGGASARGSGGGGSSSTTATGGSGGSPAVELLVDDFEDEDTLASNGFGWWYAHNDGVGDQSLSISAVSDRPGSSYAAHTSGVGFDIWGALLGLDFTPEDGSYDGSAFTRIRFWAKASPDSVTLVSAQLLESDWHFGREIELSTSWSEYVLVFDELPGEEGSPSRIDPSRLSAFQIFVLSGERFDLWIDDVVLDSL